LGARVVGARYALGASLSVALTFGRARRPALRARRVGGPLRFGGLLAAGAGRRRAGTALVLAGCAIPPGSAELGASSSLPIGFCRDPEREGETQ